MGTNFIDSQRISSAPGSGRGSSTCLNLCSSTTRRQSCRQHGRAFRSIGNPASSNLHVTYAGDSVNLQMGASVQSDRGVGRSVASNDEMSTVGWRAFVDQVSGEWDGVCVVFDTDGTPRELPEYYVPQAYRDWDVKLYDWQCQCSMHCPDVSVQSISTVTRKLMPTVGCEADAIAFTEDGQTNSFIFSNCGLATQNPTEDLLLNESAFDCKAEHILTLDEGSRIRFIHLLKRMGPERKWKINSIEIYVEKRDGPYTGRRELAGCGGGMDPFAKTEAMADPVGTVSRFSQDLGKKMGSCDTIIGLPQNCWTSFTCDPDELVIDIHAGVVSQDGTSMAAVHQKSIRGQLVESSLCRFPQ